MLIFQVNLRGYVNRIFAAITCSAMACPTVMCQVFHNIREAAMSKFPGKNTFDTAQMRSPSSLLHLDSSGFKVFWEAMSEIPLHNVMQLMPISIIVIDTILNSERLLIVLSLLLQSLSNDSLTLNSFNILLLILDV